MTDLRKTRFPGLGFIQQGPSLWRVVDIHDGENTTRVVGPQYSSKSTLLADLDRYAHEHWGYDVPTANPNLLQRATDGYPETADAIMREAYGPIPNAERFQSGTGYGYEKPTHVHGWQWSTTFNRWSALVTFENGWHGFTWPDPKTIEPLAA